MKNLSRFMAGAGLGLVVILLAGCSTVSVNSFQYVGTPVFSPTRPAQIQVLRALPERTFERLGEISVVPATSEVSNQKIEQALQTAAAEMGADAVVIISDSVQVTGAIVTGSLYGRTVQRTTSRVIVGIAIRYPGK